MVTVIFSILFDEVILNVGDEKQGKSYLGKKLNISQNMENINLFLTDRREGRVWSAIF